MKTDFRIQTGSFRFSVKKQVQPDAHTRHLSKKGLLKGNGRILPEGGWFEVPGQVPRTQFDAISIGRDPDIGGSSGSIIDLRARGTVRCRVLSPGLGQVELHMFPKRGGDPIAFCLECVLRVNWPSWL